MEGLQRVGDRDPALDDVLLRERLTHAHVHAALDLALDEERVDRAADVVRSDHFREPAVLVEDRDLRAPPVGEVGHRLVGVVRRRPVDEEVAEELLPRQVLERMPVQRGLQLSRRVDHRVASEDRRTGRRRQARVQLARGVDGDVHALRGQPQLLAGDLLQDGVDALPHLRPGVEERHGAVRLRPQDRAPVLRDAVADARVLDAAGDPGVPGAAVRVANGEERLLEADARAELLARPEPVADVERVAPADLPAVDADLLGQQVEDPLDREVRLVGAEAAHRAARRVVRVDRLRLDVHVRHAVGAAGMPGGALQHLVAHARVRARVADDSRPHRDEASLLVAADRVLEPHRVPLRMEAEALLAGERDEHGPRRHAAPGATRGLDVQVLLAAERPAVGTVRDADIAPRGAPRKDAIWRRSLPDALSLRVDVQPAVVLRDGERRLGLQEGVLDDCVRKVSVTTCARRSSAASTSPRLHRVESTFRRAVRRAGYARRARDRLEHLVLDVRRARPPRAPRGASRPRPRRARRRRRPSPRRRRRTAASPS